MHIMITFRKFAKPVKFLRIRAIKPTNHNTTVLACELACGLTDVERYVSRTFPESISKLRQQLSAF